MNQERILVKNFSLLVFLIFLSLFLLFLDQQRVLNPAKNLVSLITLPLQASIYQVSQNVRHQFQFFWEARGAAQKNKALSSQYTQVLAEMAHLRQVEEENKILRAQMENLSPQKYRLLPVEVVGFGRFLILNQGENAHLLSGQVVVYQNILVGKIVSVLPRTSAVALPTNSEVKIPVFVQTSGGANAQGITSGQFGAQILLDRVLQEEKISEGDLVLTSGDGDYPRGLVVGKIKKVEKQETEVFQKAFLEPLFPYEDLKLVFVSLQP